MNDEKDVIIEKLNQLLASANYRGEYYLTAYTKEVAKNNKLMPYKFFYEHILAHLPEGHEVQCKICQQTFAQILEAKPQ